MRTGLSRWLASSRMCTTRLKARGQGLFGIFQKCSAALRRSVHGGAPPQRMSIRTLRPSPHPNCCNPCKNDSNRNSPSGSSPGEFISTPVAALVNPTNPNAEIPHAKRIGFVRRAEVIISLLEYLILIHKGIVQESTRAAKPCFFCLPPEANRIRTQSEVIISLLEYLILNHNRPKSLPTNADEARSFGAPVRVRVGRRHLPAGSHGRPRRMHAGALVLIGATVLLMHNDPRRPIFYTFAALLGCRDRRTVRLGRAPANTNNTAGAAIRR